MTIEANPSSAEAKNLTSFRSAGVNRLSLGVQSLEDSALLFLGRRHTAAEAIEAIAHGDRNSSQVVGRTLDDIELPPGTTIGAVVRGNAVIMGHHDTVIEAEDHVIMIVTNKRHVRDVERLFQVSVTFL